MVAGTVALGGKRSRRRRVVALGVGVLLHLLSLTPAAASVIYCLGDDGHGGIETLRGGQRGCADCCHDEAGAHGDETSDGGGECTDVSLSSTDSMLRAPGLHGPDLASVIALPLAPMILASPLASSAYDADNLAPARGSPLGLRRHTVLLI